MHRIRVCIVWTPFMLHPVYTHTHTPVSYTHLDVYKRQLHRYKNRKTLGTGGLNMELIKYAPTLLHDCWCSLLISAGPLVMFLTTGGLKR